MVLGYTDPGSGSLVIQAFIALGGLVGVGAGIYYLVRRAVRAEILRLRDRGGPPPGP